MSWFKYCDVKKRRLRKGLWLRVRSLPQDIFDKAKPYMRFGELISWVEVKELRKNNQVLLEFWCSGWRRKYPRYTVFHILVDENPDWTVEGDLGRGANMKW